MLEKRGGPYCWIRVARLAAWADAAQMGRHGRREGAAAEYAHCASELRDCLVYGSDIPGVDPRDVVACMKADTALKGAASRRGASVGAHVLCSASPAFFRPDDPAAVGTWRPDRLKAFTDTALAAVRARYGPIAAWRVDVDEGTPHLDVFLVPASRRRTRGGRAKLEVSYRAAFGGAKHRLRELQDWFALEMKPLGLRRGEPVETTGAAHLPPRELHRRLARDASAADAARAAAEAAVAEAAELRAEAWRQAGRAEAERRRLDELARVLEERAAALDGREAEARRLEQEAERRRADARAAADLIRAETSEQARRAAEDRRAAREEKQRAELERATAARAAVELRGVLLEARGSAVGQAMDAVEPAIAVTARMRERLDALVSGVSRVPRAVRAPVADLVKATVGFLEWSDAALQTALGKLGGADAGPDYRQAFRLALPRAVRDEQNTWLQPFNERRVFQTLGPERRRPGAPSDAPIRISAEFPEPESGVRPAPGSNHPPRSATHRQTLQRTGDAR